MERERDDLFMGRIDADGFILAGYPDVIKEGLCGLNHPDFTQFRRLIDEAITFDDLASARKFAEQGLRMAEDKECLGERMYFQAQMKIIDGLYAEAVPLLDKAISFNPSDGAAYNDKALCLSELGVIDGVLELFNKGIEVEPDYATIHHNKGWFLNKLGQHEDALLSFHEALTIEPHRAVTYENMADTYENLGRIDDALKAYKEALRLTKPVFRPVIDGITAEIERLEKSRSDEPGVA